MPVKEEKLIELRKEVPYMWKVQTSNEYQALCVAYIDARDLFDLLDEVVGPANWSTEYMIMHDQMFCKLGINVEYKNGTTQWVYKMDTGTEAMSEVEKSKVSDASKRVGIQWGAGRFLYCQDIQKLKTKKHKNNKYYPIDDKGEILWDGKQLTEYIEYKLKNPEKKTPVTNSTVNLRKEPPKEKISQEVIDKISKLSKNNIKGKECLARYLPEYNKAKAKDLKLADLNNDKVIEDLINFINNIPPDGLK